MQPQLNHLVSQDSIIETRGNFLRSNWLKTFWARPHERKGRFLHYAEMGHARKTKYQKYQCYKQLLVV